MSYNPEETEKYVYMITSATDRLNKIDKTLWQLFKQKYEEYTKQPIPYDLDDIQGFMNASLEDDNFKTYISSYMNFSITWIATRIIDTLAQAIEEISTLNEQDIDLKSKFVIFDRMIKQLSELIKIKKMLVKTKTKTLCITSLLAFLRLIIVFMLTRTQCKYSEFSEIRC